MLPSPGTEQSKYATSVDLIPQVQPYLGPQICSFRYFWSSRRWRDATFHEASPDMISEIGSHILNRDRAVFELLHALNWMPILRRVEHDTFEAKLTREGSLWAVQLACLALRAFVLLEEWLPPW